MSLPSLRSIAEALDGDVDGQRVRFAPPGHSKADRSAWVELAPDLPGGFYVGTFAGDDPIGLRDHVNQQIGNSPWKPTKANGSTNGSATAASHVVASYDYRDEHGQLVYQVVRKQPKAFSQRRPDLDKPGEWVWNLKGITRLPYRLPELLAAVHDAVFIVEGEKDADALTDRAYVATCNSGGAGNWTPDLNRWFSGKTAYVIPDNDEQGRKHAQQVAENLYGIAREIRIVDLPGLPDKKGADFSDWLEDTGGDTSKLIDIAKAAPVWAPSSSERKHGKKNTSGMGSAAELRGKKFPALKYIVPEVLAEGCTLIAGRPKLGKSWLMLDIALAVSAGRFCLGESKCEQGDVLYLALEDNERRLQRRITKILGAFSTEWPTELQYATEWPRVNEGGVEAIRDWIVSARNPRLVIVDVLAMFRPRSGNRDNLYEADYHAIQGLQALAGELNVSIVIVHHVRKSGSDVDPFEKVSGILGLSGAADAVLILDKDSNGETLYGRGRDVEEIEKAVSFDKLTCRWTILGAVAEVRRTDERSSILSVLIDADETMTPRDIAVGANMPRNNVDQLLFKMAKDGEVLKAARGRYVHPERTDLVPVTLSKNDKKVRNGADAEGKGLLDV